MKISMILFYDSNILDQLLDCIILRIYFYIRYVILTMRNANGGRNHLNGNNGKQRSQPIIRPKSPPLREVTDPIMTNNRGINKPT